MALLGVKYLEKQQDRSLPVRWLFRYVAQRISELIFIVLQALFPW